MVEIWESPERRSKNYPLNLLYLAWFCKIEQLSIYTHLVWMIEQRLLNFAKLCLIDLNSADFAKASIPDIWQHLKVLHLWKNMWLNAAHADAQQFAKWLLDIGHGRNFVAGSNNQVLLPPEMTVPDIDALIMSIYPGMPLLALLVLKADLWWWRCQFKSCTCSWLLFESDDSCSSKCKCVRP